MTIITISGLPGTGTTTIATLLKKKIHLPYVYTGDIFRRLAQQHNLTLEAFGAYAENHPEVDRELDAQQLDILTKGNVILEGRLAGWIAYQNKITAVKIMLIADISIRAQRIVNREGGSIEERIKEIRKREHSENNRYMKYYKIDATDLSIYDIVIDTSKLAPEKIVDKILDEIKTFDEKNHRRGS
jgi:predicted cytidylate kinase